MRIIISKRTLIYIGLGLFTIIAGMVLLFKEKKGVELEVFNQLSTFELEDVLSESIYTSDNGKIKLLSFIFINCPDGVCPLTMQDYSNLQEQLKADGLFGTDVELVSITFDPERDTTEALREYAGYFNADQQGWKVLRGADADIRKVADELNFFYLLSDDGTGMHGTTMYIVDKQQQVRAFHKMSSASEAMNREQILEDLYQLVREKNRAEDNKYSAIPQAPIEVAFFTEPKSGVQVGQPVDLLAQVTQEGEAVADAELVRFEIWHEEEQQENSDSHKDGHGMMEGYHSEHEMLEAENRGNGLYGLTYSFEQSGTYYVMYHVDARGFHAMTPNEIIVEE